MHHKKVIEGKVIKIPIILHSPKNRIKLAGGFTKKNVEITRITYKDEFV